MDHKIKSFEDACQELNLDPTTVLPDFSCYPEKHRKAMTAHAKLVLIAMALNAGWEPDWNNDDQWKYFPWFRVKASQDQPAGFGFSGTGCDDTGANTCVGSRLCFSSSDLALYAGKQFEELYKDYLLIG